MYQNFQMNRSFRFEKYSIRNKENLDIGFRE